MSTRQKVIKIVAERLYKKPYQIGLQQTLRKDLEADELDIIEIAMNIENEFNLEISDEKIDKWVKVEDMIRCVEDKIEEVSRK